MKEDSESAEMGEGEREVLGVLDAEWSVLIGAGT